MIEAFEFEDGSRKFVCTAEAGRASMKQAWWWFQVSTHDSSRPDTQRYAPFPVAEDDTPANVQARILRYHDDLLARRAEPAVSRWGRGRPAAAPAAPAPAIDDAETSAVAP